jgi:hypothetical protein
MRVRFEMDGGFVYLPARSEPVSIDTDNLPAEETKELERLIAAAGFFELPEITTPPRGAADYLRYTISVTDPDHSHTGVQALVEYLEAKADPRSSRSS